jgi:hypothetical protein
MSKGVIDMESGNAKAVAPELGRRRSRLARASLVAVTLAAAAGLGLLASACGGSSGTQVAQAPSTNASTNSSAQSSGSGTGNAMAYSACMRKHGVPTFPDPDSSGHIKITSGVDGSGHKTGVDTNSPQFRKAQQACRKLQPKGGRPSPQQQARERQAMLKFSQCMRSHGVPKFPDPQFDPNGGSKMTIGKDVNPNSPEFKAAQKACQKLVPGSPMSTGPTEAP